MDTLKFYFVTWNVATRSPNQDLNSLLDFPSQFNKQKVLPDFYVIGLQEVKSQPQNMIMDSLFTDQWTSMFNKILCRQGFIIAKSIRLQGIILLVYTQMKHITHLRDIEAQYTKTGLGGLWGNKGAVSVRFNIYGCSICLVNCHLTAHEHLLADRIADYNTIIKDHTYHISETSNILYHDYVFWIGDLNFRTDHPSGKSPTSEEIVAKLEKIEKDKYTSLLKHDQLLAVMESGEAFSEFSEAEIKFPPTYKRKPSWTDRILYKVIENNYENVKLKAELISYNHLPHYLVSDHKPVIGQFNIKANFYNLEDYIAYEYLAKVSLPQSSTEPGQARTITLSFAVGSGVRTPGFYRFIYFSQPNNDVRSVLGISEPFEVSSKEDKMVTLDPCLEASCSSSPGRSKAATDAFTDFAGLDVSKLSRHISNDLSID
ncbi:unnamed protein product [Leptidea sinapis]|uniref:Inositol polyphosphate-related phosphatase domain-containing protein n=1 Tax=Leptidea sinapis TaxID=189913 RepID=A0A5E4R4K6_9NEOP|nr:unnamed protein product [Leptidea sinapis]